MTPTKTEAKFYLKTFITSVATLGALDVVWLGVITKRFNTEQLADLANMTEGHLDPHKAPAIATYLVMATALTAFAAPHVKDKSLQECLARAALLGFCIYGVYDLTNLAVIKKYPPAFAAMDMFWGTLSYSLATGVLYGLRRRLV